MFKPTLGASRSGAAVCELALAAAGGAAGVDEGFCGLLGACAAPGRLTGTVTSTSVSPKAAAKTGLLCFREFHTEAEYQISASRRWNPLVGRIERGTFGGHGNHHWAALFEQPRFAAGWFPAGAN